MGLLKWFSAFHDSLTFVSSFLGHERAVKFPGWIHKWLPVRQSGKSSLYTRWEMQISSTNHTTEVTLMCKYRAHTEIVFYLPGVLGGLLRAKTLCATAQQKQSIHYNMHSLYGLMEAKASARSGPLKTHTTDKMPSEMLPQIFCLSSNSSSALSSCPAL